MRIAAVADVHVGNHGRFGGPVRRSMNDRCWRVLDTLSYAYGIARREACDTLVVAGDLIHYDRPEAPLLAEIDGIARVNGAGIRSIFMLGNHEQISTVDGDNALAPLGSAHRVIESPTYHVAPDGAETFFVPFRPGAAADWIAAGVAALEEQARGSSGGRGRILFAHVGVSDEETAPWLRGARDAISIDALREAVRPLNLDGVIVGNWHDRRLWRGGDGDPWVLQVGALCPTGWNNPGLAYGGVAVWDSSRPAGVRRFEVPGPRFLSLKWAGADALTTAVSEAIVAAGPPGSNAVYISIVAGRNGVLDARAAAAFQQAQGRVVAWEVVEDRVEEQEAVVEAARATRSADTMDEAVVAFVATIRTLSPLVDEEDVIARSRAYLSKAKAT